jgi:hypothetical protein
LPRERLLGCEARDLDRNGSGTAVHAKKDVVIGRREERVYAGVREALLQFLEQFP